MKEITIPNDMSPFVVIINEQRYTYTPGETVSVPDEVYEIIKQQVEADPVYDTTVKLETVEYKPEDTGKMLRIADDGTGLTWEDMPKIPTPSASNVGKILEVQQVATNPGAEPVYKWVEGEKPEGGGNIPSVTIIGAPGSYTLGILIYAIKPEDWDDYYTASYSGEDVDYYIYDRLSYVDMTLFIASGMKKIVFIAPNPLLGPDTRLSLIYVPYISDDYKISGSVSGPVTTYFGSIGEGYVVTGDFTIDLT